MSWNYRVMKHTIKNDLHEKHPEVFAPTYTWYSIHEVFYLNGNEDEYSYTKEAIKPEADTPEELQEVFEMMKKAFDKPVLDYVEDE